MKSDHINSQNSILFDWARKAERASNAHYDAARYFSRLNYWIGIPAVGLSSIVGTTVFATFQKTVEGKWQFLIAFLSVTVAILTGIQTFLRFSERSEKHRLSGARYSAIARELEQHKNSPSSEFIDSIRGRLDGQGEEAPSIPKVIWNRTERRSIKQRNGSN
jgi:hypothetical protein